MRRPSGRGAGSDGDRMVVVIQCASAKHPHAPGFSLRDGRRVGFVAHPECSLAIASVHWAHPDDRSELPGMTWRQVLVRNNELEGNPRGLLPAWRLYQPHAYERLVATFGPKRVFILSAGWGLVRSSYPLPPYDITFVRKDPSRQRRRDDVFADFEQLEVATDGPVVFLGGAEYLPMFRRLTRHVRVPRIVPFRCDPEGTRPRPPERAPDIIRIPYRTARCTNWHYTCADHLCRDSSWVNG
jgi:hypothetical protein